MTNKRKAISAYEESEKQQISDTLDPDILVQKLFDKACLLLLSSINSLEESNKDTFQRSCLHALQIVLSLRFVLRTTEGDDLSKSLFETYTSIAASLFRAKEQEDPVALNKIYAAMNELREAWGAVMERKLS